MSGKPAAKSTNAPKEPEALKDPEILASKLKYDVDLIHVYIHRSIREEGRLDLTGGRDEVVDHINHAFRSLNALAATIDKNAGKKHPWEWRKPNTNKQNNEGCALLFLALILGAIVMYLAQ